MTVDEAAFQHAVAYVSKPQPGKQHSNDVQVKFYGLYKQATSGDLPADKEAPSMLKFVARAKHDAWAVCRGMSKDAAKEAYIRHLTSVDDAYKPVIVAQEASNDKGVAIVAEETSASSLAAPVAPSGVSADAKRSLPPPEVPRCDVMLVYTMYAFAGILGIGIAGFMWVILPLNAFPFLFIIGFALAGLVGMLAAGLEDVGLLYFLPSRMRTILLESTLLDLLTEDSMFRVVRQWIMQIMPLLLAEDDDTKLDALSRMNPSLSRALTTKGTVNLLSGRLQGLLLPVRMRQQMSGMAPQYRLSRKGTTRDPLSLIRIVTQPEKTEENEIAHAVQSSRELFTELLTNSVSKHNVDLILKVVDPNMMRQASAVLAICTVVQLGVSPNAREAIKSLLRGLALFGTMFGSASCGVLFLVWLAAKRKQRKMGW